MESYTCNIDGDARIEGYHYCMPLETFLALKYNSFILTVGIIGVDSHARDMYGNSHSQGTCVLLEIPSMYNLVQYFRSLYIYNVFSHDVTAAILGSQNNETAAMLVPQTGPVGVELFSYANVFFCSNKFT